MSIEQGHQVIVSLSDIRERQRGLTKTGSPLAAPRAPTPEAVASAVISERTSAPRVAWGGRDAIVIGSDSEDQPGAPSSVPAPHLPPPPPLPPRPSHSLSSTAVGDGEGLQDVPLSPLVSPIRQHRIVVIDYEPTCLSFLCCNLCCKKPVEKVFFREAPIDPQAIQKEEFRRKIQDGQSAQELTPAQDKVGSIVPKQEALSAPVVFHNSSVEAPPLLSIRLSDEPRAPLAFAPRHSAPVIVQEEARDAAALFYDQVDDAWRDRLIIE